MYDDSFVSTWENIAIVSTDENQGLLLRGDDLIRFTPKPENPWIEYDLQEEGTLPLPILGYRIWDTTSGSAYAVVSIDSTGGTSAFSNEIGSAKVEIISGPPVAGFGSAVKFDGDGKYIDLTHVDECGAAIIAADACNVLQGINDAVSVGDDITTIGWTIEMWVNPSYIDDVAYIASIRQSLTGALDGQIAYIGLGITGPSNASPNRMFVYPTTESVGYSVNAAQNDTLILGQWYHMAMVFDPSVTTTDGVQVTMYLNGVATVAEAAHENIMFDINSTSFLLGNL